LRCGGRRAAACVWGWGPWGRSPGGRARRGVCGALAKKSRVFSLSYPMPSSRRGCVAVDNGPCRRGLAEFGCQEQETDAYRHDETVVRLGVSRRQAQPADDQGVARVRARREAVADVARRTRAGPQRLPGDEAVGDVAPPDRVASPDDGGVPGGVAPQRGPAAVDRDRAGGGRAEKMEPVALPGCFGARAVPRDAAGGLRHDDRAPRGGGEGLGASRERGRLASVGAAFGGGRGGGACRRRPAGARSTWTRTEA
jgi:hypothetical protein